MVSMSPSWGDRICEFEPRHETCLVNAGRLGIGGPINKLPVIRAPQRLRRLITAGVFEYYLAVEQEMIRVVWGHEHAGAIPAR